MTLAIKSDSTFSASGLPLFIPRLNGFSMRNLVSLQRLADSNPVTASKDDVTGITVACGTANASPVAEALSGGGLHLKGNAWLPTVGEVDVTQPFTLGVAAQVLTTASGNVGIIATPTYATKGFILYSQPSGSPTSSTPLVGQFRQSIDGVQSGTVTSVPSNSSFVYSKGYAIFIQHNGSGAAVVEVWNNGALLVKQNVTLDTLGIQGGVGSKTPNLKFSVGTSSGTFIGQDLNCEAIALWNKALTTTEKVINYNAFKALATARGRGAAWTI